MKPNRIIHVTSSFSPVLGGMEKVVQILTKLQTSLGFKVSVITSNPHLDKNYKDSIEVTRLKNVTIANTIVMPKLFFKLLTLNRNDVVHLHVVQAYTPEMVFLASKIKGFKYIAQMHLDVPPSGKAGFILPFYKKYILKHVLKNASKVIVMTQDHKNLMCQKYNLPKEQVEIIPNATDHKITTIIKQTPRNNLRLLFVGRLSYQKNIPFLLESIAFYAKTYNKKFHLNIVGDGELKKNLEKEILKLKLDKLVTLVGSLKGEALEKIYQDSDIFLLSSTHEAFALVLPEAMSKGLPIVSTAILAVRNIVKNGRNGLLVKQKVSDFAAAIHKLVSDKTLYSTISKNNIDDVKNYTWEKSNQKFINTYSNINDMKKILNKIKIWYIVLPLLAIANVSFLLNNLFGSFITLAFFLFVPGYLALNTLDHGMKSRWKIASFSLGLSLFIFMFGGLLLNTLNIFGLQQPLTTKNIFIMLDLVTLIFLFFNRNKAFNLPDLKFKFPSIKQIITTIVLTFLPLLAAGGAISLNNGGSNIFTMISFGLIPLLFMYLIFQKDLKSLYPYAILTIGLSVLLSTSLRGWLITGHDIHHEFQVFQNTSNNSLWPIRTTTSDPYNSCLSITILPTMIAKITTISAMYIYKFIFQIIFALGLIPLYLSIKELSDEKKALIGSLLFISFPPFINDIPFLNRQEIAFIFFNLLVLTTFIKMAHKPKTTLTLIFLVGLMFSHYSTNYTTLGILFISWFVYNLLAFKLKIDKTVNLPILDLRIILIALVFTFLWNSQITKTTLGVKNTIKDTFNEIVNHNSNQSNGVSYALFSIKPKDPQVVLNEYAGDKSNQVSFYPEQNLPITKIGTFISHVVNVETFNKFIRAFSAKFLQILLLIGLVIFTIRFYEKSTQENVYLYSLTIAFFISLVLITLLPRLSVDYSVTRLFQQALIIISLPIIIATEFLFGFFGRFKGYIAAGFFAFLFLHLSGFIPQILGGYPPQLALNNSGTYYNIYYFHKSELAATNWLNQQNNYYPLASDPYARLRFLEYPFLKQKYVTDPVLSKNTSEYLYQDYSNTHSGLYANFLSGNVIQYSYTSQTTNGNLLYSNQDNRIYEKK